MHRKAAIALVVALALGAASCGSSDEPLTRAELVRQADATCQRITTEGRKIFAEAARNGRRIEDPDVRAQLTDLLNSVVSGLEDLQPPDELKSDFDQYVSLQASRTRAFATGRDSGGADTNHRAERLAATLGLRVCS